MVDLAKDAFISFNSNTAPVWLFQYTILGPKIPESPEINTRTEPEPKKEPKPEPSHPYPCGQGSHTGFKAYTCLRNARM